MYLTFLYLSFLTICVSIGCAIYSFKTNNKKLQYIAWAVLLIAFALYFGTSIAKPPQAEDIEESTEEVTHESEESSICGEL